MGGEALRLWGGAKAAGGDKAEGRGEGPSVCCEVGLSRALRPLT